MTHSTLTAKPAKERREKPYPDWPLSWHTASQQWRKKVQGRHYYFGRDNDLALAEWLHARDYLLNGLPVPPVGQAAYTLRDLANAWLTWKQTLVDSGELSPKTFKRYHGTAAAILKCLGKTRPISSIGVRDLEQLRAAFAKRLGPTALKNELVYIRQFFAYAYDSELIDAPVRSGRALDPPNAKTLRKVRNAKGPRLFTAKEVKSLLENSQPNMKAMILLALNAGQGNTDVAQLQWKHVSGRWVDYPRAKTGIVRRFPLWPETLKAIEAVKPESPDPEAFVFIGRRGVDYTQGNSYRVGGEFTRVAKKASVLGRSFYDLRHTFKTVAEDETSDEPAVEAIMGHSASEADMSSRYRQSISDRRLSKATNAVRRWLYGKEGE